MASFCNQCADEMGFEPDFVGMISEKECEGGYGILVLCEGCGTTVVNHLGECISPHCLLQHGASDAPSH